MCTMAWGEDSGKLWVCFNRDEQRSRPEAEAFALHEGPNGPVAYARDPQGGGTWFAVSSRGFVVALLNAYLTDEDNDAGGVQSRGLIVKELVLCDSFTKAIERFSRLDLSPYSPFHLFLMGPSSRYGFTWDGKHLTPDSSPATFWTTSSRDPDTVINWRKQWWKGQSRHPMKSAVVAERLRMGNRENPGFGATMDREDARTVSQIHVEVEEDSFTALYRGREPDGVGFKEPIRICYPA
ncbi:NRDE family protein [Puniceicoccales bacterium CK1056]|uniref:NRDE family protein n=1 Tax=Oceanipulchritudo coccoides TaxID=2706888 RepID=A0A6B2M3Z9_9BACT|nr:NRDE family protein [Oceanipulchritudo coccoides]NDV62380.1 NRDE family protein [Oceanipulchritudo coccoides]